MANRVWKGVYARFLGAPVNFFDPSSRQWRKKESKNELFIVATNIVASSPPEGRPTGMPHTCVKSLWPGWGGLELWGFDQFCSA